MSTKKATKKSVRPQSRATVAAAGDAAAGKNLKTTNSKKKNSIAQNKLCNLKLPPEVHIQLTQYGKNNGLTMIQVCGEAVNWFMRKHASKPFMMYLAHFPKNKLAQFWIPPDAYSNAVAVGKRDGVAVSRVIYTAMMFFYDSEVTGDKLFKLS